MEQSVQRVTKDEASFLRGNHYIFTFQNNHIELWTSSFSGKEVVKVNGERISEARSYRKISQHDFTLKGQNLMLELHTLSLLKGPVNCTLHVEDTLGHSQPYARKQLRLLDDEATLKCRDQATKSGWLKAFQSLGEIALWGFLGFWLAYLLGSFSVEFWLILITAVFAADFVKYHLIKKSKRRVIFPEVVIEEVSIEDGVFRQ